MTTPLFAVTLTAVIAVVLGALVMVVLSSRSKLRQRLADAETDRAELAARIEALEAGGVGLDKLDQREHKLDQRGAPVGLDKLDQRDRESRPTRQPEYVITDLGESRNEPVPAIPAPAFADQVVRETVVYAASFVHGVRRALSPEVRNRIAFEMKREVKRSRKSRKAETREALREYRARRREDVSA